MSHKYKNILLFIVVFAAVGCGVTSRTARPSSSTGTSNQPKDKVDTSSKTKPANEPSDEEDTPPPAMNVSGKKETQASLMQAYRDWEGTPYKLGGASKKGVDCSRFVNIVFGEYFGVDVPTNTKTQLNAGDHIRRGMIGTGDLIFFRTGRKTLHVGIAVNEGEFLHASTSNGVMISKLGNSYWRNRFLEARRIF